MNKKQRTEKLKELKENVFGDIFAEEIDEMVKKIKTETIDKAEDMDQVKGARIAIKYFDKLKKRIQRPSSRREDLDLPSWE